MTTGTSAGHPASNRFTRPALLRRTLTLAAGFALTALYACGGGDSVETPTAPTSPTTPTTPTNPPVTPAPATPGIVQVTVAGLPADIPASISVVGPQPGSTFSRTATGQVSWTDVPTGRYTVTVNSVRGQPTPGGAGGAGGASAAAGAFAGYPASFDIDVPAGGPPAAILAQYRPVPSALAIELSGLPDTTTVGLRVTPPGSSPVPVTQSGTITAPQLGVGQLTPDSWRIAVDTVNTPSARYEPNRAGLDTTVGFGDTLHFKVNFKLATGSLALAVTGLPSELPGNITLVSPTGTSQALTATRTLTKLEPGRYVLTATPVTHNGVTYRPAQDSLVVNVDASLTAAPATIHYTAQTGQLELSVSGLPTGATPSLTLTGNQTSRTLSLAEIQSGIIDSLPSGNYTLTASEVSKDGHRYSPNPGSQTVAIATGERSAASVAYSIASGSLELTISGLPSGLDPNVQVTGAGSYVQTITSTGTVLLKGLTPGQYTVTAKKVGSGSDYYASNPQTITVEVSKGITPATATVSYALVPTTLNISVTGLPQGVNASLSLTGPVGEHYSLTASQRLSPASPGRWRLAANPVLSGGSTYTPNPTLIDSVLEAGSSLDYSVHYSLGTGSLALAVTGLPTGTNASIQITGPNGFSRSPTGTITYTGLTPGNYTVSAASVSKGATSYSPTPASQTVSVSASPSAAPATVTYTADNNGGGGGGGGGDDDGGGGGGGLNLKIEAVHLTQAVQSLHGNAPLTAGRDALLRVFVTATQANTEKPAVRVRLYNGATLVQTETISAPELSVRTSVSEGALNSTWNMLVSAARMTPNLKVLVDLDPDEASADTYRADNTWPSGGTPQAMSVFNTPTFNVRFVPVTTGALTGNVTSGNASQFTNLASQLWPITNISTSVRAPFTSSAASMESDGTGWYTVISEIDALRATDGASATTHYYGVVKVTYNSGVAGLGFVPGRTAIGWDYMPSGDEVAAHEWGHNFSLPHAPCGGVAGADASYPYAGGKIGQWGWDSFSNSMVSPNSTDLMGYCNNIWVSDYNWSKVLYYRNSSGFVAQARAASGTNATQVANRAANRADPASAPATGQGLLVWGRISNGSIILEPAFRVSAPVTPAATSATHRLDLLDASGRTLLTLPIETNLIDHPRSGAADGSSEERTFAVIVPWSSTLESSLSTIRLSDNRLPTRTAVRASRLAQSRQAQAASQRPAVIDSDPQASLVRSQAQVRINWTNSAYEMAMVRDASSGEVLGFVRRAGASVNTGGRAVEVVFSDGARSEVRR